MVSIDSNKGNLRMKNITTRVELHDRNFIVTFDSKGEPLNIKERKMYDQGPHMNGWYNAPYWHHSAKLGKPHTMPQRILKEARIKAHIPNAETIKAILSSRK
jgi:hypothetical protein